MNILADICEKEYRKNLSTKRKIEDDDLQVKYKKRKIEFNNGELYYVNVKDGELNIKLLSDAKISEITGINILNCKEYSIDKLYLVCNKENIITNKNCTRYIRFLKVKINQLEKVFVTKDLFSLVKSKANISRDTVRKIELDNQQDVLFVKIPDFSFNIFEGQSQFVYSIDAINKILPFFEKNRPNFVNYVKEEVIPYMESI
jgi:hypothetical protein